MKKKLKPSERLPKRLKKLIIDACQRHSWNIGVSHYTIDVHYMKEDKEEADGYECHAEIIVSRRYLKGDLRIYPIAIKKWKEHGDKSIEELVSHEISHLATQHMMDLILAQYKDEGESKDAWETLTEMISKMSLKIDSYEKK